MAVRRIPETDLAYHLIEFDKDGVELPDRQGNLESDGVATALADRGAVTDVFLLSHGWLSDHGDAIAQYDRWLRTSPRSPDPSLSPLLVALHWPSKAWSNRPIAGEPSGLLGSPLPADNPQSVAEAVSEYAASLSESEAAVTALTTILEYAASLDADLEASDADALDDEIAEAYRVLAAEAGVESTPGDDQLLGGGWDPTAVFADAAQHDGDEDDGLLGGGLWSSLREAVLAPLRQLTFWNMKERARTVGGNGVRQLLESIQSADRDVRVHLAGHSFGTIVLSASVRGPASLAEPPRRPVESMFLVQGAVSLWAFAPTVPRSIGGGRGYFADLASGDFVSGPILATRSRWDYAVARFYPLAVRASNQYLLGALPKFGGIGAFGIQGVHAVELPPLTPGVAPVEALTAGRIYNIDASAVIASRDGPAGAHSDIAHDELTFLAWNAARSRR